VSTQPSSKSRLLKEGAKAGDFVSVEQPINDERPLNKRLRDEASEWDVDESVVHLLVEAADAIEHMAAALVAVRADNERKDKALRLARACLETFGPSTTSGEINSVIHEIRAAVSSPGEEQDA
jgi:hypothetical protein